MKGFFVLYFGNTEGHNRNQVLTVPIHKKQSAELAFCMKRGKMKGKKHSSPQFLLKNRDTDLLIGLPSAMQVLCDWSKNRNQVSRVLLLCINHKIILHFKCLPISSSGYNAGWSVTTAVWKWNYSAFMKARWTNENSHSLASGIQVLALLIFYNKIKWNKSCETR